MERNPEDVKAELLVLASAFHAFCVENGIRYSIHGGTMLGAVREKGFIPWDDDIDVTFTRNEYIRFEKAFFDCPPEGIRLNRKGLYPRLLMKRNDRPVVWIDIFIYDYITDNSLLRKYKIARLKMFNLMFRDPETLEFTKQNSKGNALRYAFVAALVKYGSRTDKAKLLKRAEKVMVSFPGKKNWLCRTNDTIIGMPKLVPGHAMDRYEMIPFENTELMISSDWHEILVSSYGNDYMIPRVTTEANTHQVFINREIINAEEEFRSSAL